MQTKICTYAASSESILDDRTVVSSVVLNQSRDLVLYKSRAVSGLCQKIDAIEGRNMRAWGLAGVAAGFAQRTS